jgi:putative transposase
MIVSLSSAWNGLFLSIWRWMIRWTKPSKTPLLAETIADLFRSRADLLAENALLRQQVLILHRQVKHLRLSNADRIRLVLLSHFTHFWQNTLLIVQP